MARTKAEFDKVLSDIDVETTRVATRVLELLEQIKGGGLTEAEEEDAFAKATAQLEKLKLIGADPENPVPGEEETPTDPNA
jgi:hypothetical protein